jgi:hypothetical protein
MYGRGAGPRAQIDPCWKAPMLRRSAGPRVTSRSASSRETSRYYECQDRSQEQPTRIRRETLILQPITRIGAYYTTPGYHAGVHGRNFRGTAQLNMRASFHDERSTATALSITKPLPPWSIAGPSVPYCTPALTPASSIVCAARREWNAPSSNDGRARCGPPEHPGVRLQQLCDRTLHALLCNDVGTASAPPPCVGHAAICVSICVRQSGLALTTWSCRVR